MVERIRRPLVLLMLTTGLGLGLAIVLRDAHASSPTPLLPDVVADSPDNISLEVSTETPTKEPTEARLLLRFDGYVHNIGPGALDFRGSREAPTPGEPASPPMGVYQRIYNSNGTYTEEPSKAQMVYVEADGHNHWHLQHVAFYSLWNSGRSAEVAPAQKVGFCLEDSERIEETGPSEPIYADSENTPFGSREFCRRYQPEATNVFEGISEGWRDLYQSSLAFQWVDVSDVLPGEYWLRAETDPEHLIRQTGGEKPPAYATSQTIVPGFDAEPQSQSVETGLPLTIELTSRRWSGEAEFEQPSPTPSYTVATPPAHGTLGAVNGDQVQYTPANGYSGPDSFTFAARDPNSPFPTSPAIATVSITVTGSSVGNPATPSVAISGAPASMIAATSVQLSATVSNDSPGVTWSATAGTITSSGRYTAPSQPPAGGNVTVAVQAAGGARDQRSIRILPVPPKHAKPRAPALLNKPGAMLIGRRLYMSVIAREAGRLRLTALLRGHPIASCSARVKRHQSFTCSTTLPRGVSSHAPISVWATIRVGHHTIQTVRPALRVPTAMKARAAVTLHGVSWRGFKQAWRFFCGM
jgi:hypothetical protein